MNKRLLKKLSRKNNVTKEDAQEAFNIVAGYLNKQPNNISFFLNPWVRQGTVLGESRFCITSLENDEFKDILIADTVRPKK